MEAKVIEVVLFVFAAISAAIAAFRADIFPKVEKVALAVAAVATAFAVYFGNRA